MNNKIKSNMVPPIVSDWIQKMKDTKSNIWHRQNYCQLLENIIDVALKEVTSFKADLEKHESKKKRAKR